METKSAPLQEYHELIERIGEAMQDHGIAEINIKDTTIKINKGDKMQDTEMPTKGNTAKAEDQHRYGKIVNDLKEDLNNFLFNRVPGNMTINEFEDIATEIHNKIYDIWTQRGF